MPHCFIRLPILRSQRSEYLLKKLEAPGMIFISTEMCNFNCTRNHRKYAMLFFLLYFIQCNVTTHTSVTVLNCPHEYMTFWKRIISRTGSHTIDPMTWNTVYCMCMWFYEICTEEILIFFSTRLLVLEISSSELQDQKYYMPYLHMFHL